MLTIITGYFITKNKEILQNYISIFINNIFIKMSRVTNCGLENFDNLPFDFTMGACSSIMDQYVLMCFDWIDSKSCHK